MLNRPVYRALLLILACICFRLLSAINPALLPNISPLMAVAFVGAMFLPMRWGWLVGPATLVITDLAFVAVNRRVDGTIFSSWTFIELAIYALAGGLGLLIARHRTLPRVIGGTICCSLVFYVAANTVSWWANLAPAVTPGYPASLAGWWQANTVGLPGWAPTWLFLRNGVLGDLFFALVLLAIFDRAWVFGFRGEKLSRAA
jgi:hypothetical protein